MSKSRHTEAEMIGAGSSKHLDQRSDARWLQSHGAVRFPDSLRKERCQLLRREAAHDLQDFRVGQHARRFLGFVNDLLCQFWRHRHAVR